MTVSEIKEFARIAKIGLTEAEAAKLFDFYASVERELDKLKASECGLEPLVTVCDATDVTREDKAVRFISRDELLSNAVEEVNGYFQAPKTLE